MGRPGSMVFTIIMHFSPDINISPLRPFTVSRRGAFSLFIIFMGLTKGFTEIVITHLIDEKGNRVIVCCISRTQPLQS